MKKLILLVALLSSLAQAQYIAKLVNGQIQPSHLYEGSGFIQANNRDFMVRGASNFTAAGQFARYYVGDGNHVMGASYGSGLFFNTYKAPYALFIKDGNGFVGLGTNKPDAVLTVNVPAICYQPMPLNCSFAHIGGFYVNSKGNPGTTTEFDLFGGAYIDAEDDAGNVTRVSAVGVEVQGPSGLLRITSKGIVFPDGTVQTTAK